MTRGDGSAARSETGRTETTALVLAGGGVAGIAWEIGVLALTPDPLAARRAAGEFAREVEPDGAPGRGSTVSARLPVHEWPHVPLRITAVDAHTGEVAVFDGHTGVALDDAVTASCAVPGVWPVVPIGDRVYIDGGVASLAHA
ncbi:MAG TPA: patatin-like phospholipase family protein [Actinomycetospora sp.]|uniref:patatin-like phospholipase family protein n=1 Tax=Actinomycetospora sp. TaxID=1872135 RepID=UPI002F42B710